jgi:integrase
MATVTIQKRKNIKGNSYVVTYKDPLTGKKKYYKTFNKHRIAQQEANDLRSILDSGKSPKEMTRKITTMNFSEVATSLEEEWSDRFQKKEISEKTIQEYKIWLNVLKRKFGKRILCGISTQNIEDYRNGIAKKESNISANKYIRIIKMVFKKGIMLNAVVNDPAECISMLSEKEHERNRYLLPNEIGRLVEVTKQIRAKHYLPAMIYLGAEHGASKQEILSLKWSDINFDYKGKGLIRLYRTKNRMERTHKLMPRTKMALLDWQDHLKWMRHRKRISTIKSNHVFCHLDGTPFKSFNRAWWRVLKFAEIDDFHFHDLRHTYCSNLILSGAGLKEVKDMIGHRDIAMTDRYSHLTNSFMERKQNLLAEHYDPKK